MLQYRNTPLKANSVELLCSLNIEILSDVETNSLDLYFQFLLFVSFFCHYNDFKKAALFTKAVHQEKKKQQKSHTFKFPSFWKMDSELNSFHIMRYSEQQNTYVCVYKDT